MPRARNQAQCLRQVRRAQNARGSISRIKQAITKPLVTGIITANLPGFYVFSAPWETVSALLANINKLKGYGLTLPASYGGPNHIYAISIAPSGKARLVTYNSNLHPPSTYPKLPTPTPVPHSMRCAKELQH